MRKSHSFIATPPGATIKEQIVDRGMSQKEFASRMDMSEKHISKLINGEVILTPDVAIRLEMVLGLPARFWNNLESIYREKLVMVQQENTMDEDMVIARKFPYKAMQNLGWIEDTTRMTDRVFALRKYFEIVKLTKLQAPLIPGIAYRKHPVSEEADYTLLAWAQKAKLEARNIETRSINLQRLEEMLPEIRKMANQQSGEPCKTLCELLAECGIAFVVLPYIGDSLLHGATFYDKNKIIVALTDVGEETDKLWSSFFHEIAHILYGHINNPDGTSEEEENAADRFAEENMKLISMNC